MIFEVELRISYASQTFVFATVEEAVEFARMVLEHSVTRDDGKKIEVVMISVKLDGPTEEEVTKAREENGDD